MALATLDTLAQSIFIEMFGDPNVNQRQLPRRALRELIRVKSGNGLIASNMAENGKYPVYGGNGVNGYHDQYMFAEPKIVIGRVGVYCGIIHITKQNAWVTDNALFVSECSGVPRNHLYQVAEFIPFRFWFRPLICKRNSLRLCDRLIPSGPRLSRQLQKLKVFSCASNITPFEGTCNVPFRLPRCRMAGPRFRGT
jgi:hypothetical protein